MTDPEGEPVWRQLRRQARQAADRARAQEAATLTTQAFQNPDLAVLDQLVAHLEVLGRTWPVHRTRSRIPLLGPLLSWLGTHLSRFFLQNQVAFNAEVTRTFKTFYQAQRVLLQEQIDRTDYLLGLLEERVRALEARLRDLEAEVDSLQER